MKLCKECRHFCEGLAFLCSRKAKDVVSRQTGITCRDGYESANIERFGGWITSRLFGLCGEEGRFWESKTVQSVPNNSDCIEYPWW